MIVHSYYYGPIGENGLDFKKTEGLTKIISEDIIRRLYTQESKKPQQFDNLYMTATQGPVIAITRITPTQAHDNRSTYINRTLFVKLRDVVTDLAPLLDEEPAFPLEPVKLKLVREETCQLEQPSAGSLSSSTV